MGDKEKDNDFDVKALASLLKNQHRKKEGSTQEQESIEVKEKDGPDTSSVKEKVEDKQEKKKVSRGENKTSKPVSKSETSKKTSKRSKRDFMEIINEVNQIDHYELNTIVRIDDDVHEIFNRLKSKGKAKIYPLISFALEEFIKNHYEEIKMILEKENRLL